MGGGNTTHSTHDDFGDDDDDDGDDGGGDDYHYDDDDNDDDGKVKRYHTESSPILECGQILSETNQIKSCNFLPSSCPLSRF